MLVPGQENASQELRTCGPPRLGITFPNQFSHGINETEMWLDLQNIRQDGDISGVERFYSIRIFEDGFTEIKYESNVSRGYAYRGETLESAIAKAREGGMSEGALLAIRYKIREGISNYRTWIAKIGSVAEVSLPDDA